MKRKEQRITWLNWTKSKKDMTVMFVLILPFLLLLSGCTSNNGKDQQPEIRFVDRFVEIPMPTPLAYTPCELPKPDLTTYGSFSVVLTQADNAIQACNEVNKHASEYNMRLAKKETKSALTDTDQSAP